MWIRGWIGLMCMWVVFTARACSVAAEDVLTRDNCILGAGPGGLQMASLLEEAGRDYVVFEKEASAGSFFSRAPRFGWMTTPNKKYTGSGDTAYNLRYDRLSLVKASHNATFEGLGFPDHEDAYRVHPNSYQEYLQTFADARALKIRYGVHVTRMVAVKAGVILAGVEQDVDSVSRSFGVRCRRVFAGTGLSLESTRSVLSGLEHVTMYEDAPTDPEFWRGKTVAVIGDDSTAMEVISNISLYTRVTWTFRNARVSPHLSYMSGNPMFPSWDQSQWLDQYLLKAGEVIISTSSIRVTQSPVSGEDEEPKLNVIVETVESTGVFFDVVVLCDGWEFDWQLGDVREFLEKAGMRERAKGIEWSSPRDAFEVAPGGMFPATEADLVIKKQPNVYAIGELMLSAGPTMGYLGTIAGFRHAEVALFHALEYVAHQVPLPQHPWRGDTSHEYPRALATALCERLTRQPALFNAAGFLTDIVRLPNPIVAGTCADHTWPSPDADPDAFWEATHMFTSAMTVTALLAARWDPPSGPPLLGRCLQHRRFIMVAYTRNTAVVGCPHLDATYQGPPEAADDASNPFQCARDLHPMLILREGSLVISRLDLRPDPLDVYNRPSQVAAVTAWLAQAVRVPPLTDEMRAKLRQDNAQHKCAPHGHSFYDGVFSAPEVEVSQDLELIVDVDDNGEIELRVVGEA